MIKRIFAVLTIGLIICSFMFIFYSESAEAKRRRRRPPTTFKFCVTNSLRKPMRESGKWFEIGHKDRSLKMRIREVGSNSYSSGPIVAPGQKKCMDITGKKLTDIAVEYKSAQNTWRQTLRYGGQVGGRNWNVTCTNNGCQ